MASNNLDAWLRGWRLFLVMAEANLELVMGDPIISDASLEAWLVARASGLALQEHFGTRVGDGPAVSGHAAAPVGQLPIMLVDGWPVWDSLAMCELIAEVEPTLWPTEPRERAHARSIAAELHHGLPALRNLLPMDLCSTFPGPGKMPRAVETEIARLIEILERQLSHRSGSGGFLFGRYGIVDAIATPLVTRVVTYGIPTGNTVGSYVDDLLSWPHMVEWLERAHRLSTDPSLSASALARLWPAAAIDGGVADRGMATTSVDHHRPMDTEAETEEPAEESLRSEPLEPESTEPEQLEAEAELELVETAIIEPDETEEPEVEPPEIEEVIEPDEAEDTDGLRQDDGPIVVAEPEEPDAAIGPLPPLEPRGNDPLLPKKPDGPSSERAPKRNGGRSVAIQPIGAGTRRRR